MAGVSLRDSRFSPIPKIRATREAKRKSVGIYNARLFARGDSSPFTSSPTVSRCGSNMVVMVAIMAGFEIHSIGAMQAFLPSDNLSDADRRIVIPPSMIPLPRKGKLRIAEINLRPFPIPSHGFLILRPLYGTRDSPLRWFAKLSKCLIHMGLRQMKADIFTYSILDSMGNICGFVIVHVGDILYTGTSEFLGLVKKTVSHLRAGVVEVSTREKE